MLWTIAVILTILWLLGLVSSYTMGGFIHLLLVLAVVVVLVGIIQGRRLGKKPLWATEAHTQKGRCNDWGKWEGSNMENGTTKNVTTKNGATR